MFAGRSDNGDKFSLFNGEGHTVQRLCDVRLHPIVFFEFRGLQNAHGRHHPFCDAAIITVNPHRNVTGRWFFTLEISQYTELLDSQNGGGGHS